MGKIRPSLALAALGVIGLAMWAGGQINRSGTAMAIAAERLVAAMDESQKGKATFSFDSPERLNWHFIPRARKGLPVKEMTPAQRALAFGLLETGLGASGNLKATTIMSLEEILRDLEKGRGPVRDPELYYFSIFGNPSNNGLWGWRVEGHHLSLNFTLDGGRIVAATPAFFGSNPGEVREGPRKGLRTLGDLEDRALRLLQALDDDQKRVVVVAADAPKEVRSADFKGEGGGLASQAPNDTPKGLAAAKMSKDQRGLLMTLIEAYAHDMSPQVAAAWLDEIAKSGQDGQDRIHFAWSGPADRTQPHAYTVQGPTFLIEFNNTQNNANHIHSLWRNMLGDFGLTPKP
jgi:hypothetical protein